VVFVHFLRQYDRYHYNSDGKLGVFNQGGSRSLLYSLANTIFRLYMVLNLRFVVGILTVPHIVSEIQVTITSNDN